MNFTFLLKKEIKDFIYSYQCWGCVLILLFLQKILSIGKIQVNFWLYLFFVCLSISQFIYDSYSTDIKEHGILFINNLNIDFFHYTLAKQLSAVFLGIIFIFMRLSLLLETFTYSDLTWMLCLISFASFLMFICSILTEGSEMGGSLISAFVSGIVLIILYVIKFFILRVILLIFLNGLFFFICKKLYNSLFFRKQI